MVDAAATTSKKFTVTMEGHHGPIRTGGIGDVDPHALLLKVNGQVAPAADGQRLLDGTSVPQGRNWIVGLTAGSTSWSLRRADAPDTEIASTSWQAAPVMFSDPAYGITTPYPEHTLLPDWLVVRGSPAAYTVHRFAIDYGPTSSQTLRLYATNNRLDSTISARVVEVNDLLELVPGGFTAPVFSQLAIGGVLDGVEIASPRVRVALEVWADLYPAAPRGYSPLTWPNTLQDAPVGQPPSLNQPIPDGSILTLATYPRSDDTPEQVGWAIGVRAFVCRDPRFRDLTIAQQCPCDAACAGVDGPPSSPTPAAAARSSVRPFAGGTAACDASAGGPRCTWRRP